MYNWLRGEWRTCTRWKLWPALHCNLWVVCIHLGRSFPNYTGLQGELATWPGMRGCEWPLRDFPRPLSTTQLPSNIHQRASLDDKNTSTWLHGSMFRPNHCLGANVPFLYILDCVIISHLLSRTCHWKHTFLVKWRWQMKLRSFQLNIACVKLICLFIWITDQA